ncbi:1935_t:CDS:2 [Entrophospora sp. SA101]|nr:1935_t:CDS:2 [Entrophospora sp. SA101]
MLPIKNFRNIITQTLSSRNFLIQRHQIPDINSILILPSPSAIHHHQTTLKGCHCRCLLWNFSKYKDFIATGTKSKNSVESQKTSQPNTNNSHVRTSSKNYSAIVDSPVVDESNLRSLQLKHLSKNFITQKDGPIFRYNTIVASGLIRDDVFQRSIIEILQHLQFNKQELLKKLVKAHLEFTEAQKRKLSFKNQRQKKEVIYHELEAKLNNNEELMSKVEDIFTDCDKLVEYY